jgi:tRNA threonylcarbamoyladenosine biosynthesis protein TsaE
VAGIRGHVVVRSEVETRKLASELATGLVPGSVILVSGDLGAGKTVFVRGLAEGLGVHASDVTSPTFTLVHEYRGGRLPLIHVDLYRVSEAELDEIGLDTELADQGIVAVEWPERLVRRPAGAVQVRINDQGGTLREIRVLTPDTS